MESQEFVEASCNRPCKAPASYQVCWSIWVWLQNCFLICLRIEGCKGNWLRTCRSSSDRLQSLRSGFPNKGNSYEEWRLGEIKSRHGAGSNYKFEFDEPSSDSGGIVKQFCVLKFLSFSGNSWSCGQPEISSNWRFGNISMVIGSSLRFEKCFSTKISRKQFLYSSLFHLDNFQFLHFPQKIWELLKLWTSIKKNAS